MRCTSWAVDSTFPPSSSLMSCPKRCTSSLISWASSRTFCLTYWAFFSKFFIEDFNFSRNSFISVSFWYRCCNSCSCLLSSSVRGSFKNVSIAFFHSFAFSLLIWPAILTRVSLISLQRRWNSLSVISMSAITWAYIELRYHLILSKSASRLWSVVTGKPFDSVVAGGLTPHMFVSNL